MKRTPLRPLTVAGLMSGTSADGIDVALVHIEPRSGKPLPALLAHRAFPFPRAVRAAVLAAQDAASISVAELARLHWRLGMLYAQAYSKTLGSHPAKVDLVGCHGQTIYHQGKTAPYAGARFACTWQIGETALLARAAGVPVVSNFRPADMAAGGQGAPLVPLLDQLVYRHPRRTRVLQNIGGIGNLTAVPPAGSAEPVVAFDTGPGNMVIDAFAAGLFGKPYDRNGATAARGRVLETVVKHMLRAPFFALRPPRSGGREQFGGAFTAELLRACRERSDAPEDAIATATALTAHSIALALTRFVLPSTMGKRTDLIISGGGAKNGTLMRMLDELLKPHDVRVLSSADASLPSPMPVEAKEAAAFALLAYMSVHGRPGNVPSATGAHEPAVLGQVNCA